MEDRSGLDVGSAQSTMLWMAEHPSGQTLPACPLRGQAHRPEAQEEGPGSTQRRKQPSGGPGDVATAPTCHQRQNLQGVSR